MNELKTEVLTRYGKGELKCVMCGYSDIRALCIDHIAGDGKYYLPKLSGRALYRELKKGNFPSGYQTLCFNCNFIKSLEYRERHITDELRQKRADDKIKKELGKYKTQKSYEVNNYSVRGLTEYIKSQPWYFFSLKEVYQDLNLNKTKQTLFRATCLKLLREGKLQKVGRGRYEKLVVGVNC